MLSFSLFISFFLSNSFCASRILFPSFSVPSVPFTVPAPYLGLTSPCTRMAVASFPHSPLSFSLSNPNHMLQASFQYIRPLQGPVTDVRCVCGQPGVAQSLDFSPVELLSINPCWWAYGRLARLERPPCLSLPFFAIPFFCALLMSDSIHGAFSLWCHGRLRAYMNFVPL